MANSFVLISAVIPTTKMADIQDFIGRVNDAAKEAGAARPDFSISTRPLMGIFGETTNGNERLGRQRADDEAGSEARKPAARDEAGDADDEAPRRKRGRPAGSGKAAAGDDGDGEARSRSAARERDGDDDGDAEGGKAAQRGKSVGTRKGADEGADEGEGRRGGAERGGDDQRGNRKASRVKDDDGDGWGDDKAPADDEDDERREAAKSDDPWPNALMPKGEITKDVIASLLGAHHAATGAKDRELTFDIIERVSGERTLAKVDPEDYRKLAKALLKDTARYEFGLKKAAGKAKRSDD